jgi:hypothetical protein
MELMSERMSETRSAGPRLGGWVPAWITALLTISAAITLGFWLVKALDSADTEALESPLMLSVARQLAVGPGELYGPFGGRNPLVLIHAPLYYRAAALTAWPMARAGLHPVTASRIAGRSLSALGLFATLVAAYYLVLLGGGSRRAAWWSVLLIAASPVLSGQPFAVRPDMAGVALQTAGVLLVLSATRGEIGSGRRVIWGYAVFGLAACVKQHLVAAAAVSTMLLLLDSRGDRVRLGILARGLAVGAGIVALIYGLEWVVTGGRIWEAAFVAARDVGRVHPGGWDNLIICCLGLISRSIGLIVLLAAAALIAVSATPGIGRKLLLAAGLGLIALIIGALSLRCFWIIAELNVGVAFAACILMGVLFPICSLLERSKLLGNRVDAALWIYLAAELIVTAVVFYLSTGSWLNYAIQAVVFAAVLTARAASRVLDASPSGRIAWPAALAILTVMVSACNHFYDTEILRRIERAAAEKIFAQLNQPPSAFFFINRPGFNRVDGRFDLVYDHWLYPVFESRHLAEPRSGWLAQSLGSSSVRGVVATTPESRIEGTPLDLRRLGYHPDISVGPFYVWTR